MIKCIAIDDQAISLEGLAGYISSTPGMVLSATYQDPFQALKAITAGQAIDLLFMDVNMPFISGIELAKAIRHKAGKLIFTTAFTEYAFDAFEAQADAYLLKPYGYAKFATTVNRLFPARQFTQCSMNPVRDDEWFLVKNKQEENRAVSVRYDEIIAFESFNNYVKIHTAAKTIIAYLALKDVREQLKLETSFIQLHRAFIIALKHITQIDGNRITLSNKMSFNVGDSFKSQFRSYFADKIITSNRKK